MARAGKDFRDAVAFAADQFGVTVEAARKMIQEDWIRNGNMVPGWLPANWRDGRLIYTLQINRPLRWIDPTAAEPIAALNRHLGQQLDDAFCIGTVTLGTLSGENGGATTAVAQWLRERVLDDGNYAAGVEAHSKYGGGHCWAYWLRRQDDLLGPDPVLIAAGTEIHRDDADLDYVLSSTGWSAGNAGPTHRRRHNREAPVPAARHRGTVSRLPIVQTPLGARCGRGSGFRSPRCSPVTLQLLVMVGRAVAGSRRGLGLQALVLEPAVAIAGDTRIRAPKAGVAALERGSSMVSVLHFSCFPFAGLRVLRHGSNDPT